MTTSPINPRPIVPPGEGSGRIVRVDDAIRLEAVQRLVGGTDPSPGPLGSRGRRRRPESGAGRAQAEQFIEFSEANGIRLDAMWAWLDPDGRVGATVLAVPNPGRTAILFGSAVRTPERVEHLAAITDHACRHLIETSVHLGQVLLDPGEHAQREAFLGGGFHELARLSYMECPLPRRLHRSPPPLPAGVELEAWSEGRDEDVLRVLDASYEDTLDCPGLRGLRDTADILAGHRGTGAFEPELWTILRVDDEPVGVLLLNRSPSNNTLELVYTGLARRVQGRGLGRLLLRHGLHGVGGRSERAVTLAVDDRNAPAIALYRGEGFRRVLRRVALIRSLRAGRTAPDRPPFGA